MSLLKRYVHVIRARINSIPHRHCARLSHSAMRDGMVKSVRRNANTVRRTHKQTYNRRYMQQRPINTLLICNWSIVIRLLCVGRCSLASGDGECCSRGICRCPRRPAYRNNLHAGNSSETNCNSSYYLRRTRYNFEQSKSGGGRQGGGGRSLEGRATCSLWEYFTVINDRATFASSFCCTFFFIARTVNPLKGMKIGSNVDMSESSFLKFCPAKERRNNFPSLRGRRFFVSKEETRERGNVVRIYRASLLLIRHLCNSRERVNKWQYFWRKYILSVKTLFTLLSFFIFCYTGMRS